MFVNSWGVKKLEWITTDQTRVCKDTQGMNGKYSDRFFVSSPSGIYDKIILLRNGV